MFIRIADRQNYQHDLQHPQSDTWAFKDLIRNSTFGGAPRGDNLYSYRFAETMSAGSIPVVYADHWLPPFHEHVIHWAKNCCAVFIPERDMAHTTAILRAIPPAQVCEMQQNVLHVWDRYLSSREGWLRGLVQAALAQSNLTVSAS